MYSSELSAGLKGVALRTCDLDGAVVQLSFNIYPDSAMKPEEAETERLGTFFVDGSAIKRSGGVVNIKAADGLMLFDIPSEARSGSLYEIVSGACLHCGVGLATAQAEFEAFPNGTAAVVVNTARIQTERDLLMFAAMMTGCFARITRDGRLEFVPLTCTIDEKNMIIPVREIAGNIRFKTEFSDDTSRIAKLFTRRKGSVLSSTLVPEGNTSEKLAVLELDENPLLSDMSDDDVKTALNNQLAQLFECLNRAFDADFNGDPALEVGDYVRLRGGAIDTDRGYATGMITSQIWRYHGQHTIKCTLPSSLTAYSAVMTLADTAEIQTAAVTDTPDRVQPKSQIEKRIDALETGSDPGAATKLIDASGSQFLKGNYVDYKYNNIGFYGTDANGSSVKRGEFCVRDGYFMLFWGGKEVVSFAENGDITIQTMDGTTLKLTSTGNGESLEIQSKAFPKAALNVHIGDDGSGSIVFGTHPKKRLEFRTDGLYYNGLKVLLQE